MLRNNRLYSKYNPNGHYWVKNMCISESVFGKFSGTFCVNWDVHP